MAFDKPMIKSEYLRYFSAAADAGSISGAARALHVSSTSIVRAIDMIEDSLKISVFTRTPSKGLTLTKDGRTLLGLAENILADLDNLEQQFCQTSGISGTLRLGCPHGVAWSLAPFLLESINEKEPDLLIELTVIPFADTASGIEKLRNNELDVLLAFDLSNEVTPDIETEPMATVKPYAMMRKNHPLANQQQVTFEQIARYPQAVALDGSAPERYMKRFTDHGLTPDIKLKATSNIVAWAMVSVSDMITIRVIRPPHNLSPIGKEVVYLPLHVPDETIPLVMRTAKQREGNVDEAIELFKSVCRDFIQSGEFNKFTFS